MIFNPRKWLEDGFRRLCGGVRRKTEKKKMKKKHYGVSILPSQLRFGSNKDVKL
jgi:hypothetical protein